MKAAHGNELQERYFSIKVFGSVVLNENVAVKEDLDRTPATPKVKCGEQEHDEKPESDYSKRLG